MDLVIQSSPPKDWEQYVHRSGRTGRAGRSGISITFFTHREAPNLPFPVSLVLRFECFLGQCGGEVMRS